jgi:predicted hotdog family 3-hydroxylacyl-ACP dehydratase
LGLIIPSRTQSKQANMRLDDRIPQESSLPHTHADIERLIPHQGDMCLLDRVQQCTDEMIVCTTTSHRSMNHPLRIDGRLAAIHLCEYGAQAMAVHGGLLAQTQGSVAKPGLLVALREVKLSVDTVDSTFDQLEVRATRINASDSAWQYRFSISAGELELASGRATVMMRETGDPPE